LRDAGPTEVAGFGITAPDDLLLVQELAFLPQRCTPISVAFDELAVASFFDQQIDLGRRPEQFARIWIHTHPGSSAEPSDIDEETFARVFGRAQWAVMMILARGGAVYTRLQFHVGPGGQVELPVEIDYRTPFGASDEAAWQHEYRTNITEIPLRDFLLPAARAGCIDADCDDIWNPFFATGGV